MPRNTMNSRTAAWHAGTPELGSETPPTPQPNTENIETAQPATFWKNGKRQRESGGVDSSSSLSDLEETASPRRTRKKKRKSWETDSDEESDEEDEAMWSAIKDAGDGDSLLGEDSEAELGERYVGYQSDDSQAELRAAALRGSDHDDESSDEELLAGEEKRIIADEEARIHRKQNRKLLKNRNRHLFEDGASGSWSQAEDEAHNEPGVPATTLSPDTLRALGLTDYDIQDDDISFSSSSDAEFGNFLDGEMDSGNSSDSEATDSDADESNLDALTTDDSGSDLSALEAAILAGEPLVIGRAFADGTANADSSLNGLVEGLVTVAGSADGDSDEPEEEATDEDDAWLNNPENAAARAQLAEEARRRAEMPLLVIEDLDGRLIYARAGNGEAVFGSDGEFEYIGEESEEDPYDYWSDIDEEILADITAAGGFKDGALVQQPQPMASPSRQAQADAEDDGETTDELPEEDIQFSRLLVGSVEPHGGRQSRRRRALAAQQRKLSPCRSQAGHSRKNSTSHSVSDVPTEPAPVTPPDEDERIARLDKGKAPMRDAIPPAPVMPETPGPKPAMGSFVPTSANASHRAVIDGSKQVPSPFAMNSRIRNKGLGFKRQRPKRSRKSLLEDPSIKRQRRFSIDDIMGRPFLEEDTATGFMSQPEDNDEMQWIELDDVVDEEMLTRATAGSEGDNKSVDKTPGFNDNAFARWNKVPMRMFRDAQQQQQEAPRASRPSIARNYNQRSHAESSPFRGRAVDRSRSHLEFGGMDAMLTPTTLPSTAMGMLAASPILFPQRNNPPITTANATDPADALPNIPHLDLCSDGHRKITRREKRDKKARRTALHAALLANKAVASPLSPEGTEPNGQSSAERSPSSAELPQVSVSNPSPIHSRTPSTSAANVELVRPTRPGSPSPEKRQSGASFLQAGPIAPLSATIHASNALPPSSAAQTPLFSPLFGGAPPPEGLEEPDRDSFAI